MPSRSVLVGLLLLATLPPFLARAAGETIGTFAMFTRIDGYHLDVSVETPDGVRPVSLESLAPHLSRDAKQYILPARGYAASAGQSEILADGLSDLAQLVCELHRESGRAHVRLERGSFPGRHDLRVTDVTVACGGAGSPRR